MTYDKDSFLAGLSVGMSLRYSKRIPPEPVFIIRVISSSSRVSPNAFHLGGTQLAVDWGDGTYESFGDHTSGSVVVSHVYANSGELFTVKIYFGELTYLMFSPSFGGNVSGIKEVITPIPRPNTLYSASYMFEGCSSLEAIPSNLFENCPSLDTFVRCFRGCSALSSIPNGLFDNCTAATNFSGGFNGCTSLTTIPNDLFRDCVNASNFSNCFYGCSSIISVPQGLFSNNNSVSSFTGCFGQCSGIIDSVPELWVSHASAWGDRCYRGCTNASNYADIPSGWK